MPIEGKDGGKEKGEMSPCTGIQYVFLSRENLLQNFDPIYGTLQGDKKHLQNTSI
jgi:hypothetical protein